ncbi:MAG: ASKHA domain-containing protein [Candidatus Omnitrophica bacterium]|nr:ASKHA domain-containing protein [Candidatus Omnitrophota bacterium]
MHEFNVKFILPGGFFIFKPSAKNVTVPKGTDLLTAAVKAGIVLNSPCGGEGVCGKCKVTLDEKRVLACETIVDKDLVVKIPKESLEIHEKTKAEAEEFTKGVVLKREDAYPYSPIVRKIFLKLAKPTADDNTSDLDRIYRELSGKVDSLHVSASVASVKFLSETLRDSDFQVTVTLGYKDGGFEIMAIEPGDTAGANYGFAFDIGTTTVVGQLINMNTRKILGTRIAFNRQAAYGSDVIARIVFASEPDGLEKTHKAVVSNINEIIEDLVDACNVNLGDVYSVTCAGNMTMMHLLLRIDPSSIRKPPYTPTTTVFSTMHLPEIGIDANPKGLVTFLPGVSTYIGGDIVSGLVACGVPDSGELALLVDIGTNGELVLGNSEWMIGTAASAGPAFEGSGLSCGMKAVKGAVQKVDIDAELNVRCATIGDVKPHGICGSGYIDLLRQMLKRGIIDKSGKINKGLGSKRIRQGEAVMEFVVAFKAESGIGKDIVINEDDIDNLKRSKGAIYSAIIALLTKVEKDIKEVKKIYIAGGFGNYLNIENAISIGLLPDIERTVYEFIGNSSLAGARMSLLSADALKRANEIYKNITYIDLSSEPSYMNEYIAALFFPHTDLGRFPSVRS